MYGANMYDPIGDGHYRVPSGIPTYPNMPVLPNGPIYQNPIDLLHVKGTAGAREYQMNRDSRVALFDEDEDYVYIKKTDSNGQPSYRKFKLIEEPFEEPSTFQNGVQYVTMEEFNRFKEEILNAQQSIQSTNAAQYNATTESGNGYAKSNGSNKRSNANG